MDGRTPAARTRRGPVEVSERKSADGPRGRVRGNGRKGVRVRVRGDDCVGRDAVIGDGVRRHRGNGGFHRGQARRAGLTAATAGEQADDPDDLRLRYFERLIGTAGFRLGLRFRTAGFRFDDRGGFLAGRAATRRRCRDGETAARFAAAFGSGRRIDQRGEADERDELGAGEQGREDGKGASRNRSRSSHRPRCRSGVSVRGNVWKRRGALQVAAGRIPFAFARTTAAAIPVSENAAV